MPRLIASAGAPTAPLDVRDPDVVAALADTVAILGTDLRPRTITTALGGRTGFSATDPRAADLDDWVHPDDRARLVDALGASRAAPGADIEVRARVRHVIDGWHTVTLVFRNLLQHPDVQGILVRAVDQTVLGREARWRTLVAASPIGIYEVESAGGCVFVNPAFERLTGVGARDALGDGWCRAIHPDDLQALLEQQRRASDGRDTEPCRVRLVDPDGELRWVSARWAPLCRADGTPSGFLGTLEDVTERHRLEERLEHDATHDRLTGLGSRALLVEELTGALARTRRGGDSVALLFIDLDGFKRVNDMLGHAAGDELLVQVAARLRAATRQGDVCVRLGGDEFVVCCPGMEAVEQASPLAERLLAALSDPYDVHGHEVLVGASIGIATAEGEDPVSVDQLLSNADLATYRAKRLGRGRVELFDDELRRRLAQGRRIGRTVARLLDQPRLPILCTPIAHLRSDGIVGFDCAVDWERAGLVDGELIDRVVEEAGMARALDLAMVRTLLAYLSDWEHRPPGPIVPGLSTVLTRSGAVSPVLPEMVRDLLGRSHVTPALCWIGIPESAVAHDFATASRVVAMLDELGIGVALRDFGSAVSSLEQLRRLPTPTMTIAGPLVAAVNTTDDDVRTTLLAAIVQYARALGRIVVASGVQDAAHATRLRELGCDFGSGPAFGPTIRPEQVEAFLATRSP